MSVADPAGPAPPLSRLRPGRGFVGTFQTSAHLGRIPAQALGLVGRQVRPSDRGEERAEGRATAGRLEGAPVVLAGGVAQAAVSSGSVTQAEKPGTPCEGPGVQVPLPTRSDWVATAKTA